MSIEIQCMTEKLIVITIKLDYSKVPRKSNAVLFSSTLPTTLYKITSGQQYLGISGSR